MPVFKRKKVKAESVKAEPPRVEPQKAPVKDINHELTMAQGRLNHFMEMRKKATTTKDWDNFNFWVAHFKKVIADLNK